MYILALVVFKAVLLLSQTVRMLSDVGDAALQEAVATFANEPIDRVRVVKAEWLGHGAKVGDGMTSVIKVDFNDLSFCAFGKRSLVF